MRPVCFAERPTLGPRGINRPLLIYLIDSQTNIVGRSNKKQGFLQNAKRGTEGPIP